MGTLTLFDIKKYITSDGAEVFIETGTGMGGGVIYAQQFPFTWIYSFEVNDKLYEWVNYALRDKKKRTILLHEDSLTGLPRLLKKISKHSKILFWLDAHYPNGADFNLGTYEDNPDDEKTYPLYKELEAINTYRNGKDIILMDDIKIYDRERIRQLCPQVEFVERDEVYGVVGKIRLNESCVLSAA